jgi:hypothetical protein
MQSSTIPGYTYGQVSQSPVSLHELELLKQTVLFSDDDVNALRAAGRVLAPQTDAILDVWYGFVGAHPHLLRYFSLNEQPDSNYLSRVRTRFGQWILDLCNRPYDQQWLDYQHEIGLRHTTAKKNLTDGAVAEPLIHLRYLTAFIVPLTATIRPFLQKGEQSEAETEAMHAAWFKAVTLTATLWSYPYVKEGQF